MFTFVFVLCLKMWILLAIFFFFINFFILRQFCPNFSLEKNKICLTYLFSLVKSIQKRFFCFLFFILLTRGLIDNNN